MGAPYNSSHPGLWYLEAPDPARSSILFLAAEHLNETIEIMETVNHLTQQCAEATTSTTTAPPRHLYCWVRLGNAWAGWLGWVGGWAGGWLGGWVVGVGSRG